jgi:hypothetical protein
MNTVFFSLVVLLALSSTALAIVCTADICNAVKCAAVTTDNCPGKIVLNGGFCGCCDACKAVLQAGETCDLHVIGMPSTTVCDDGLVCNHTSSKCEAIIV